MMDELDLCREMGESREGFLSRQGSDLRRLFVAEVVWHETKRNLGDELLKMMRAEKECLLLLMRWCL